MADASGFRPLATGDGFFTFLFNNKLYQLKESRDESGMQEPALQQFDYRKNLWVTSSIDGEVEEALLEYATLCDKAAAAYF